MGIYKTISEEVSKMNKEKGQSTFQFHAETLSFFQKAYCASIAGFVGALFANPADLALVRMQADNQLPVAERRNYKNVFDAFGRIAKEDGVSGLWRGATPTVIRAVVLNLAMLASYDEAKEKVLDYLGTKQETLQVRIMYRSYHVVPA
jgi:solute carrier family 25 oxoglutarate transporter 11